jgi:hypothetical protein
MFVSLIAKMLASSVSLKYHLTIDGHTGPQVEPFAQNLSKFKHLAKFNTQAIPVLF